MQQDKIIIIDLGSTRNVEVARTIRSFGVYSEILPHDLTADDAPLFCEARGIILNGGPNRLVDGTRIDASDAVYNAGLPVLSVDCNGEPPLPNDPRQSADMLKDFVFDTCKAKKGWNAERYIAAQTDEIRTRVGDRKVMMALSGGVDSSVVAALLLRAVGDQVTFIHVNTGLMRKGESEGVVRVFRDELGGNLIYVDAVDRFLDALAGVEEPEKKRKIIGEIFIRIFEEQASAMKDADFLAQGTIYPDIIESGTKTVKAIKSHHNVGGLPEDMHLELLEPLKMLFKDEVRAVGSALGLPDTMVYRQPFPGPGLGVRCVGAITRERLEAVRESDAILREEFAKAGLDRTVWQYFTVVPDFRSVGMRDHERTYEWPCILRAVNSVDAMTATIEPIPYELLAKITERITSEVKGINRVLYDVTPKPSGTIEWE